MSAGPRDEVAFTSYSHRRCEIKRDQQLKENKVANLENVSCKGKNREVFPFPISTSFSWSKSNCIECTQRFSCAVKQCKAMGFLSFSFPEHFSKPETKPRSPLGRHFFSIYKLNQKKVMEYTLNPALTLPLFNYRLVLPHFWPVPVTLSQIEECLALVLQASTGLLLLSGNSMHSVWVEVRTQTTEAWRICSWLSLILTKTMKIFPSITHSRVRYNSSPGSGLTIKRSPYLPLMLLNVWLVLDKSLYFHIFTSPSPIQGNFGFGCFDIQFRKHMLSQKW